LNFAANLGGANNALLAGRNGENGTLNTAVSMFGTRSRVVAANGFLNAAAQIGGSENRAFARNGSLLAAAQVGGSDNAAYAQNGAANAAAQLGGSGNQVYAQNGAANAAAQFAGASNIVTASTGSANAAAQLGGSHNIVQAGGEGPIDGYFTAAFSVLSNGQDRTTQPNTVQALRGPLAIAGSVGQDSATVVQNGPGINVNRSSAAAKRASSVARPPTAVTPMTDEARNPGGAATKTSGRR